MPADEHERTSFALTIRLTETDLSRLSAVADNDDREWLTRTAVLKAAMRIGLDAIEKRPALFRKQAIEQRGGPRERKQKTR